MDNNEKSENPIINNRIINDKTFAVRLFSFLDSIKVDDMASYEEKNYLLNVSKKLINYQLKTITKEEMEYFRQIGDILKEINGKLGI